MRNDLNIRIRALALFLFSLLCLSALSACSKGNSDDAVIQSTQTDMPAVTAIDGEFHLEPSKDTEADSVIYESDSPSQGGRNGLPETGGGPGMNSMH